MTSRPAWRGVMPRVWRCLALLQLLVAGMGVLRAQDQFEIHVLEYEQLAPGEFTFETHLNYVGSGTRTFEGTVAPTQDQLHVTYELTGGITSYASFGVMQLNAKLPGSGLQAAGWRLVPHFYIPARWHWPVDVGLVAEFAFEKAAWSANSETIELVPILEKHIGRTEIDVNPEIGRALHGPDVGRGWDFGIAARVGYRATKRFTPTFEYYGDWGKLPAFAPLQNQSHLVLPGADFHLGNRVIWNVGVGFGLTSTGDQIVYKSRIEISFGRPSRH
jgi:hypothetical protein